MTLRTDTRVAGFVWIPTAVFVVTLALWLIAGGGVLPAAPDRAATSAPRLA